MAKKKMSSGEEQIGLVYYWWIVVRIWVRKNIIQRFRDYRARRPHRSFKLTRRRDYVRPLEIGGYWSLTFEALKFIKQNGKNFRSLLIVIVLSALFLIGLLDGNFLASLQEILEESNKSNQNIFGEVGKAGLLVFSTFTTGGLVRSPTEAQKIVMFLLVLFVWLATVQLARNALSGGKKIKLRDALYSCGAPIVPMAVICGVIFTQLVPAFIAVILISAAKTTSFASEGIENALFMSGAGLLVSISTYWVLGSLFAMILVTIPGTYPFQALKISGDIMSQRRLKILLRVIWLAILVVVFWLVVLVPLILLSNWLAGGLKIFAQIPLIQIAMLTTFSASMIFSAVYIYLLYRRIVSADRG